LKLGITQPAIILVSRHILCQCTSYTTASLFQSWLTLSDDWQLCQTM